MSTKEERTVIDILGPSSKGVHALVCAIEEMETLLFEKEIHLWDIHITRSVYPRVADRLQKKELSAARQIQRLCNRYFESMSPEQKLECIGKELSSLRNPWDMLIYFAYYCHYDMNFYDFSRVEGKQGDPLDY